MSDPRKLSENAIHEIFLEAANEKYPHSHQVLWLIWHIEALEKEIQRRDELIKELVHETEYYTRWMLVEKLKAEESKRDSS